MLKHNAIKPLIKKFVR